MTLQDITKSLKMAVYAVAEKDGDYLVDAEIALGQAEEFVLLRGGNADLIELIRETAEAVEDRKGDYLYLLDVVLEQLEALK